MTNSEKRTLTDKFMLRLPDGMRDRIKHAAEKNNRSMNAEILATLEENYPEADGFDALMSVLRPIVSDVAYSMGIERTSEKYTEFVWACIDRYLNTHGLDFQPNDTKAIEKNIRKIARFIVDYTEELSMPEID